MSQRDVIVLHDSYGVGNERAARKLRFKERPRTVSRHDVLWRDVKPAVANPPNPWDRPAPSGRGQRRRTHGRAAQRRVRSARKMR